MPRNRICLFVGAALLAAAGLSSLGLLRGPVEGLALLGFAFWCVAGAVEP